MSATRFSRLQKATALVPLALLSAAWTVDVTGLSSSAALTPDTPSTAALPDGTTVPSQPIDAPASVSGPSTPGDDLSTGSGSDIVATAASSGIPAAALAAYQRAATVIDNADKGCHLDWALIAAIGRVESNHGRADGNTLTASGLSTPGIFGPELTGKGGTTRVTDSDGGQYDHDARFDRAVGPMQFIPSTWSMVGVDADGDGKRNPQDINDAALATAVYLCAGDEDLSTPSGERAAVFRYNHSQRYVATVLAVASSYRAGDYTSVPNSTITTDYVFTPDTTTPGTRHHSPSTQTTHSESPASTEQTVNADPAPSPGPTRTDHKSDTTSSGGTKDTGSGGSDSTPSASPSPTADVGGQTTKTVEDTAASVAELTQLCTAQIKKVTGGEAPSQAVQKCVDKLTGDTVAQATKDVTGVVQGLLDLLSSLLGGLGGLLGN